MNDTEILDLFFARDPAAIAETADRYGARLYALANNILHCPEDAEEAVSDTYYRVWNAIPPARPAAFRHYLSRVTRNLALDRLRRNRSRYRSAETLELLAEFEECLPDGRGSAEDAMDARETGRLLNAFLAGQDELRTAVFLLRFYYAFPVRTIAERTGLTERQVKYTLSCLRRELKNYLESEGVDL